MDIKQSILSCFDKKIAKKFELNEKNIVVPPNANLGDFCVALFSHAKTMHLSPTQVASLMLEGFDYSKIVEKTQVVGGYLNFFVSKKMFLKSVVDEILACPNTFGSSNEGSGKTVCIDFSSINMAKYMHIGHLSSTVIGNVIRNLHNFFGYKTIAINYVGDYGTPFGKMVRAHQLWGNENDLKNGGIGYAQDLYIRFCKEASLDNGELDEQARETFKKIEQKDGAVYPIYLKFMRDAKIEAEKIYNMMGISFDSWRGESYYCNKMQPVIDELKNNGLLLESNGAQVVNLENYNLGVALVVKSDGSTIYLTRDLAACEDRFETYNFCKSIYVTDVSQKLHFAQLFKIMQLLKKQYADDLEHVYYGRISLPDGKISSRLGKQALLKDIIEFSMNKAKKFAEQNSDLSAEEKQKVVKAVGVGAVVFCAVKNEKIKDSVFDITEALDINGETSPYIQYTCARCHSIENKADAFDSNFEFDFDSVCNQSAMELAKALLNFKESVRQALEKREPCLVSRNLIDISKAFNKYYSNNRVIDNGKTCQTRLALVLCTKNVLQIGLKLLGIEVLSKM